MAPLRLQPRKCNNPGRDCETAFVPGERNPNQKYCSEACGREADHWRRANAPDRNPAAPPVDRDAEQMAAIRAREARQREEAERLGVALAANAERRYVLWLELLGVRG